MNALRFCLLVCVVILVACSPVAQIHQETPSAPGRVTKIGYSLAIPAEPGWIVRSDTPTAIYVGRVTEGDDESFVILAESSRSAIPISRDELVSMIKSEPIGDSARFILVTLNAGSQIHKEATCAFGRSVIEDHNPRRRSGMLTGYMIMESHEVRCVHPQDRRVVVRLVYSHRHYPGQPDLKLNEKAAIVLESLEFRDL